VSFYSAWTLSVEPATGSILYSNFVHTVPTSRLPIFIGSVDSKTEIQCLVCRINLKTHLDISAVGPNSHFPATANDTYRVIFIARPASVQRVSWGLRGGSRLFG
jgi:hypothetical protein